MAKRVGSPRRAEGYKIYFTAPGLEKITMGGGYVSDL